MVELKEMEICNDKYTYRFKQLTPFCPMQYDIYLGNQNIAYLRLRHGLLTVDLYGEKIIKTIFSKEFDDSKGFFKEEELPQFINYLNEIAKEIDLNI